MTPLSPPWRGEVGGCKIFKFMSINRIKKRQEQKGSKLLNKLFLEFTQYLNRHSSIYEGCLFVDEQVYDKLNECNNTWRGFVNANRRNPKSRSDFAVYAFEEKAKQYWSNLKKQIWKRYMIVFVDERYGLDTDYDELENYYQEDLEPNEAGIRMVLDLPPSVPPGGGKLGAAKKKAYALS